jgi:hypothetical protein
MRNLSGVDVDFSRFDFKEIFGVVKSTANMTQKQLLFLRTHIQELSVAKYSDGQLVYVGDKENGIDFRGVNQIRYESKAMNNLFMKRSPLTLPITLKKFQKKKPLEVFQTFDYMLLWDTTQNSVGICDWEDVKKGLVINDASVTIRIRKSDIICLENGVVPKERNVDILEEISNLIDSLI